LLKLTSSHNRIDIIEYSADATLEDLVTGTENLRSNGLRKTKTCIGCGNCCMPPPPILGADLADLSLRLCNGDMRKLTDNYLAIPHVPPPELINKQIAELVRLNSFNEKESRLLFEYNNSEPITFKKKENDSCIFFDGEKCTIYEMRPFICRLYNCVMGNRLSVLEEMIVAQGTWHAYSLIGLIQPSDIGHNPFINNEGYKNIKIGSFEYDFEKSLTQIFGYF